MDNINRHLARKMVLAMNNSDIPISETEEAYDQVMDAIVIQQLAPGQKVSENILSDMFGFTRTIARNLIEQLTAQQFLITESQRITRVSSLSLLEIKQNFSLRKLLMPDMAVQSIPKLDFEDLERRSAEFEAMLPVKNNEEALAALKINQSVNLASCGQVDYPLMRHWHRQLEYTAMRIYWFYVKTYQSFPYVMPQQQTIIDTLKSGDKAQIKRVMIESITDTEERILNAIFSNKQFLEQDLRV